MTRTPVGTTSFGNYGAHLGRSGFVGRFINLLSTVWHDGTRGLQFRVVDVRVKNID